jgi:predicted SAM-dependent methyltransferase
MLTVDFDGKMLALGCGNALIEGAVNHDLVKHSPHVDVAHDLDDLPWPWADESFGAIFAIDVVEHLRSDVDLWLNECHRILSESGVLVIRVPHYSHENAYTDPTHRRFFAPHTFDYWDKSKLLHQKYGCFYYEKAGMWWSIKTTDTDGANILFSMRKA